MGTGGEEIEHQPTFFLLRDDATVILTQTRIGILQENYVFRVAWSCMTTVIPQQFFSFTLNGRTKLSFDIQ